MMRAVIFANGMMEDPKAEAVRWIDPDGLVIAADGGTFHALDADVTPDVVIGDQDSLTESLRRELRDEDTIFENHPPAKDETDLELALCWTAEQAGVDEIVILGGLGGRPDQTLANLLLLAMPVLERPDVWFAGGGWVIRVIRPGPALHLDGAEGDRLSLIPLGGTAEGVRTTGLAYPLNDETLGFGPARGVSNVFEAREVTISLRRGLLWCFHECQPEGGAERPG
jgi:thiamine pyrophosphokinase